jgi:hypothetical protein
MKHIDIFIAGAQKAGTTSLKNYLGQHPKVCTHRQMEMGYFYHDYAYNLGYGTAYCRYFGHCQEEGCVVLAKNVAVMYDSIAIERLHEHNPCIMLVLVLRNPVDRAYSAYWYARQMGYEDIPDFDEAVWLSPDRHRDPAAQRNCAYLYRGLYVNFLQKMLSVFPNQSLVIFRFESLKNDPVSMCKQIFKRIGIEAIVPDVHMRHNPASAPRSHLIAKMLFQPSRLPRVKGILRKLVPAGVRDQMREVLTTWNTLDMTPPPMNPKTRLKLIEFFKPYNQELNHLLGEDLSAWDS